jgi:hypothetical protein
MKKHIVRFAMSTLALAVPNAITAQTMKQIPMPSDPVSYMQGEWLSEGSRARIRVEGKTITLVEKSQFKGYWPHLEVGNTIAIIVSPSANNSNEFYRPYTASCNKQDRNGAAVNNYVAQCYIVLSQNRSADAATIILQVESNRFYRSKDLTEFQRKNGLRPLSEI